MGANFDLEEGPESMAGGPESGRGKANGWAKCLDVGAVARRRKLAATGISPRDRPVSRVLVRQREICGDPSPPLPCCDRKIHDAVCVLRQGGIYLVRCVSKSNHVKTKPGKAVPLPLSAQPGKRTSREDHALSHRPQRSSDAFLIGLLASIARLRFTGMARLTRLFSSPIKTGHFLLCRE